MMVFQNFEKFNKAGEWFFHFREMSIEFLGECVNVFFIINNVPDEAAVIVKVDRTYFWTVEEFLGNFVKETFPANEDGIMAGGEVRWILERRKAANENEEKEKKACIERGTLFTSGLIAGEGLMGVILAICAVAKVDSKFVSPVALPQISSLVIFIILLAYLYFFV